MILNIVFRRVRPPGRGAARKKRGRPSGAPAPGEAEGTENGENDFSAKAELLTFGVGGGVRLHRCLGARGGGAVPRTARCGPRLHAPLSGIV